MDTNYDIPLDDYGYDDTPYVTIEEMIQLLSSRKKQWNQPQYYELQIDEQSGLYYTDYFVHHGGDMLQEHLLIEQCLEHLDKLDWKRITNGYDFDIVPHIVHLVENPLVWVDEIPDELARNFVVTGRVAVEKSSEERSTCSPYNELRFLFDNERLEWFATQLPTSKDVFAEYAYYGIPKDMILWNLVLTDELEKFRVELYAPEKINNYTGRPFWPYCNPEHFRHEIERIYSKFGAQKAAQIVRLLRNDWPDIKVLKLFGVDELTPEQIEEFRQCLFEGMDRNLRNWESETPQQTASNSKPAVFEFITEQCRKEGKVEAVEAELRAASKGTAVAMWKTIRTNEALGYLSTKDVAASKIYKSLAAYFGELPYNERNFRDARNKR